MKKIKHAVCFITLNTFGILYAYEYLESGCYTQRCYFDYQTNLSAWADLSMTPLLRLFSAYSSIAFRLFPVDPSSKPNHVIIK
jgi:hypothetical protein